MLLFNIRKNSKALRGGFLVKIFIRIIRVILGLVLLAAFAAVYPYLVVSPKFDPLYL